MKNFVKLFLITTLVGSCTNQKTITLTEKSRIKFLGEFDVPHNQLFHNTAIGGLSGIDYDRKHDLYYLISDDRSSINPSRFYTAKIILNEQGIDSIRFISVNSLLQQNGYVYPNSKQDPIHTPDPEAIRYNAKKNQLVWSSEGERMIKRDSVILEDPSIKIISLNGNYIDSFVLPFNMHMKSIQQGPRQNGAFEGLSFLDNYKKLLVSVEEPLYEDGSRAGLKDSSGWIRIIKFNTKTKRPEAQYAYQIDPIAYPPDPPEAFKINGVPDILALNNRQILIIERSFSTGRRACTIKVYLGELDKATDVSKLLSLTNANVEPVSKKLILNMDNLGIYIDNIEGITLGPKLANGRQTLIFVSDNNFDKEQTTQFLLFEFQ